MIDDWLKLLELHFFASGAKVGALNEVEGPFICMYTDHVPSSKGWNSKSRESTKSGENVLEAEKLTWSICGRSKRREEFGQQLIKREEEVVDRQAAYHLPWSSIGIA